MPCERPLFDEPGSNHLKSVVFETFSDSEQVSERAASKASKSAAEGPLRTLRDVAVPLPQKSSAAQPRRVAQAHRQTQNTNEPTARAPPHHKRRHRARHCRAAPPPARTAAVPPRARSRRVPTRSPPQAFARHRRRAALVASGKEMDALASRARALDQREAKLDERERELDEREEGLEKYHDQLLRREDDVEEQEEALAEREAEVAQQEADAAEREKEIEAMEDELHEVWRVSVEIGVQVIRLATPSEPPS